MNLSRNLPAHTAQILRDVRYTEQAKPCKPGMLAMRDYQQSAFESMKNWAFRIVKNGASPDSALILPQKKRRP